MTTIREPDISTRDADGPHHVPVAGELVVTIGLASLGLGLLVNSVVGPLLADRIEYPFSESMRNQTIGLDATALLLVFPACMAVAMLTWRGHRLAPVLTLSLGSYVAYMFLQYVVGPAFEFYPATLLLHLMLFVAGWALTAHAWIVSRRSFADATPLSTRHAWAAVAMAGFVVLRYVPGLVASVSQDPLPDEVGRDVTMYWLIVLADLGVFLPVMTATAAGLFRQVRWARLALTATVGWFALVSVAVGAMSLTMLLNGDQFASGAQLGLFIVTSAIVVGYASHLYRDLLAQPCGTAVFAGRGAPPDRARLGRHRGRQLPLRRC